MIPLKPILSSFSGSEPGMVGQSLVYQSGDTAILPCDISVPPPPPSRRGGDPGGPRQQGSMKKMNNNRNNTDCDTSSEHEVGWKGSKPVPPPSVAQMKPPPKPVHGNPLSNGNLDKCPPVSLKDNSTSPCQTENQVWSLTRYFFSRYLAGKKIIYYLACRAMIPH